MFKPIIPLRKFEFEVSGTPAEALEKIGSLIHWETLPGLNPDTGKEYIGMINGNEFWLSKYSFVNVRLPPTAKGLVTQKDDCSVISVNLGYQYWEMGMILLIVSMMAIAGHWIMFWLLVIVYLVFTFADFLDIGGSTERFLRNIFRN